MWKLFEQEYINKHLGERFLVCGTGTSLCQYPPEWYKKWKGITIGVNTITDYFYPNYHIYFDRDNNIINANLDKNNRYNDQIHYQFNVPTFDKINIEKEGKLSFGGTVSFIALSCAYQMGASEIYLIGIDFKTLAGNIYFNGGFINEAGAVLPNGDPKKSNTFYVPEGGKEKKRIEAIRIFSDAFNDIRAQGIKVWNLSKNSALEDIEFKEIKIKKTRGK